MSDSFVYIDNACTTWPKPETVYAATAEAMKIGANPGRSSHRMSKQAEQVVEAARLELCRMFNALSPDHVIFTMNCTDSLNMALKGILKPGQRVITGPYEHNSVLRPLRGLQRSGVSLAIARGAGDFGIDRNYFEYLCSQGVNVAVFSHASNVTGAVLPVRELAERVHRQGGLVIVDAAQSAGTLPIDMKEMSIDVLAIPGHKGLLGPMGTGALLLGREIPVLPFREGGTGFKSEGEDQPKELPWRLESGTPNYPGIAGLLAGIRFIQAEGMIRIAQHETGLARGLAAGLREIGGVRLLCCQEPQTGVVSFLLDSCGVGEASKAMDQVYNIGIRGGLHCAPLTHRSLGTFPHGALRASFGYFNDYSHVERLIAAVRSLAAKK
ncbi:MAG: aminotransferase class V-fold PLP-dependent enzyme [Thermacetogeniaceae bacterium]